MKSGARCLATLDRLEPGDGGARVGHLTIHQCERVIREIEKQECDKFLKQAEGYLRRAAEAPPRGDDRAPRAARAGWLSTCGLCKSGGT